MKKVIIENRCAAHALKIDSFKDKEEFARWKNAVENLRKSASNYIVNNMKNANENEIENASNAFYNDYRVVLAWFTNVSIGEKLKPESSDLISICGFVTAVKMGAEKENGKQFLPVSTIAFRKSLEIFIADRLTNASHKSAADIEAEKAAKREKKKAERKAKKDAENAAKALEKAAA